MEEVQNYESPYTYFKFHTYGLIKLVRVISEMILFCYVPFIHVIFIFSVLFDPNWKKLIGILEKIQTEMKLDEEFHRACRRQCFMAHFLLIVVST